MSNDVKRKTLEQRFPDPRGRRKADEAIGHLPLDTTIRDAMWAWEEAYHQATGTSPYRQSK